MTVLERIEKMNRLFAAHDRELHAIRCSTAICRNLDTQAQAIKQQLLDEGVELEWDSSGYARLKSDTSPKALVDHDETY